MKSLLVALMMHLMAHPGGAGGVPPVFVVPAQPFGTGGQALTLTTSQGFGEPERQKWQSIMTAVGAPQIAAELCYQAAYKDFKSGVAKINAVEREAFLMDNGGHQMLARVAVRWCNMSLRKMDVLPFSHPEYAAAEKAVREVGYVDDVAFMKSCKTEACVKNAAAALARVNVGVGLEAVK